MSKRYSKLNIGSGSPEYSRYKYDVWINLDADLGLVNSKHRNIVIGNALHLPFKKECFDRIDILHILEHLPREGHLPLLKEAKRVLKRDGEIFLEVPDFLQECYRIVQLAQNLPHPEYDDVLKEYIRIGTVGIYGKGRNQYDFHHWGFTSWQLEALAAEAGLKGERQTEMISEHHRQQPVLLYKFHGDI